MSVAAATISTPAPAGIGDIVDALRELQTENDRWRLAEALVRSIPTGAAGFDEIEDAAGRAGVGTLSANTLRLYRDTAVRWPGAKRVENLSFSAHREAMVMESIDDARQLLLDLRNQHGASEVHVSTVRKAIAAKTGKPIGAKAAQANNGARSQIEVLADLVKGGPKLIDAIHGQTPADELDKLNAGLKKVLGHVEKLQAKAARAAAKKAPATTATAAKKPTAAKATARKAAGDLRGL